MAAICRSRISAAGLVFASTLLALFGAASSPSFGAHGHPGPGSGHVDHSSGFLNPGAGFHGGGGGGIYYNPGIYYGYGVSGGYVYSPPLTVVGPGGFAPTLGPAFPQGVAPIGGFGGGGLNLPMPPAGLVNQGQVARLRQTNPAKAKELTEIGDRSFRGRNIKRAEDKYKLAIKADLTSPIPHVHLAQVSVARGNYAAAADHLRDAVTVAADGTWLINAPDIQAIFGEPGDFARQLAKLESHLQANPNDRDAWFVLGAETYLSGRTRQAYDVFQRLTDRRPDEALTAFLDASRPRQAAANRIH
jgi:tetratricopeptide (TPR) repeat protein